MQQVYAVRIGNKYGIEFEEYINSKIPHVTWIREESIGKLQWNKLLPMSYDTDEPVVVIDIDQIFINDYMDIINYPIQRGEFLMTESWWVQDTKNKYKIQGGIQKYYPKDCKYIYDKFVSNPKYWMNYYIKNSTTHGPVNGEQYFVYDTAKEKLNIKFFPKEWTTKWIENPSKDWIIEANMMYPGDWLYLDEFNPEIRAIHYQTVRLTCKEHQKFQSSF